MCFNTRKVLLWIMGFISTFYQREKNLFDIAFCSSFVNQEHKVPCHGGLYVLTVKYGLQDSGANLMVQISHRKVSLIDLSTSHWKKLGEVNKWNNKRCLLSGWNYPEANPGWSAGGGLMISTPRKSSGVTPEVPLPIIRSCAGRFPFDLWFISGDTWGELSQDSVGKITDKL